MITFEDFSKVEFKTAVVSEAEEMSKKDKLMLLKVKCGENLLTVIAGIRPHYTPAEIIGKTIIIVTNLEPRKMGNIESQGMLLAVKDGDTLSLVTTDKSVNSGLQVG